MTWWSPLQRAESPSAFTAPVARHGVRAALALLLAIITYLLFPGTPAVSTSRSPPASRASETLR